jgi:UDP-glucuronate decarboxylase
LIDSIILEDIEETKTALKEDAVKGNQILVAGGSGFIGSWICDVLVALGSTVTCVDDFSTGEKRNIDHLLSRSSFKFVKGDVSQLQVDAKFDCILHLASRASPEEYQKHPVKTLQSNSVGSFNMLEMARKHGARILFASTSEVYGDSEAIPTPESYWGNVNPIGVRSCYDEGKRFGEALFMAYHRQYGVDVRIARIFNTYGPRLRSEGGYGRAVSRFISQALANEPLTVYGDGAQTRSFCYVNDTVRGLLSLLIDPKGRGEVVNIGNPEEITILELAQRIRRLANSRSPIEFHPLPKDDPKRRCPDINKARKLLRWKPRISLEQGLARTIAHFKKGTGLKRS